MPRGSAHRGIIRDPAFIYSSYRSLQIRCLKLTTIARYACAFDCTNLFVFRQCACVLMEKLLKKWTTDLQITVEQTVKMVYLTSSATRMGNNITRVACRSLFHLELS